MVQRRWKFTENPPLFWFLRYSTCWSQPGILTWGAQQSSRRRGRQHSRGLDTAASFRCPGLFLHLQLVYETLHMCRKNKEHPLLVWQPLNHPPFARQTPEFHTPVILQLLGTNAAALRTAREGKEKHWQGWRGPHLQKPSGCVRKDGYVRSSARQKGQRGSVCLWHASTHPPPLQTQHADV